jgi:hypothetical protein
MVPVWFIVARLAPASTYLIKETVFRQLGALHLYLDLASRPAAFREPGEAGLSRILESCNATQLPIQQRLHSFLCWPVSSR